MAKTPDNAGSDKAELKKWLNKADQQPIHVAFLFGGDGQAVVKMDGIRQGPALAKMLKDAIPDGKNHRFGTVSIDPADPETVRFMLAKSVSGAAPKLKQALKGTGYKKIQIVLEDGSVEQSGGEDEEAEPGAAAASGGGEVTAPPDAAALTQLLTGLVKQMMGALQKDPSQKVALTALATDAQASIKRGDLDAATAGLDILRLAIADASGQASSAASSDAASQTIKKSQAVWTATRSRIEADLNKLGAAITAASEGEDGADGIEAKFRSAIGPVLEKLDGSLADTLGQAAAASADERQTLMKQAQSTLAGYQQLVTGNKTLSHLDDNPFVKLSVVKTLTATLSALSSSIA